MSPFDRIRAIRAIPREQLSSTDRLVLMVLGTYCGSSSTCYPAVPTVADGCGLTTRAVYNALARLEGAGWLEREGKGPKGVTVWRVNVVQGEPGAGVNEVQGERGSGLPLNEVHKTPERGSPKESKEESKEESNTPYSPPPGDDRIRRVWEHWRQCHPQSTRIAAEFARHVSARLDEGYTVEQLQAVATWAHTAEGFVPERLREGRHLGPGTLYKPTKMLDRIEAATTRRPDPVADRGVHDPDYDPDNDLPTAADWAALERLRQGA